MPRLDDDGLCLARHLLEEALRRHLAGLAPWCHGAMAVPQPRFAREKLEMTWCFYVVFLVGDGGWVSGELKKSCTKDWDTK